MRTAVLTSPGDTARKLLLATAFAGATFGFAAAANAAVVYVGYGGGIQPPAVPPGETAVSLSGATGTGTIETGSLSGQYAAPAYSGTTFDTDPYLAVKTGQTSTLSLGGSYTGVEIYVGSLDSYNTISFYDGATLVASYTGDQLVTASGGAAVDNGDQTSSASNGLFYFTFGGPVTSVQFASSGNSLEVAGVSASNTPEASTWAMMVLGFAGLGYAAFRRSAKSQAMAI